MVNAVLNRLHLEKDLEKVREVILSASEGSIPVVRECIESIVASGGKMLRPLFLILSSRIGGADRERVYRLAAGIELLHISSLIHDDIIDNSSTRRGIPSVHKVYGVKNGVLLGDYFFSQSISLLTEKMMIENSSAAAKTVSRICESEILQNIDNAEKDFRLRTYIRHITGKTAVLFILSFHLGAVEGGCSGELQSVFRKIGYNTGIAFQIIDDILDFTGRENKVGKPVGNDLRNGIITAPAIFAVQEDPSMVNLLSSYNLFNKSKINKFISMAVKNGAIEKSRKLASSYTDRAIKEIGNLPEGDVKTALHELVSSLLVRDN